MEPVSVEEAIEKAKKKGLRPGRVKGTDGIQSLLLGLLDGLLDAHGFHDHPIPPGRVPTRAPLQSGRRYIMVVSRRRPTLARDFLLHVLYLDSCGDSVHRGSEDSGMST